MAQRTAEIAPRRGAEEPGLLRSPCLVDSFLSGRMLSRRTRFRYQTRTLKP
jgi:hypothetical protein